MRERSLPPLVSKTRARAIVKAKGGAPSLVDYWARLGLLHFERPGERWEVTRTSELFALIRGEHLGTSEPEPRPESETTIPPRSRAIDAADRRLCRE